MASPLCTVNGASSANGTNVTGGSTVTVALVDPAGVRTWALTVVGADDLTPPPNPTVNQTTHVGTFIAPGSASAVILRSQVNGGIGPDGQVDPSLTTTFGVYVRTGAGLRLVASNETTEGNTSHGWIAQVNARLRTENVQTLNVPFSTYTDTNLTTEQASADALIVTGGTDGGGYSIAFPPGFTRPGDDSLTIYEATGVGFSVVLNGDTWFLPGWGTLTIRWWTGDPPSVVTYYPVLGTGDVSHVLLGNGQQGLVPAVALPAPAAGSKGGVALPASATGLAYMDWGGFGTSGVAAIANGNADQTLSTGQASNFVLIFSGALTAYRYVTLPLTGGRSWWIINNCSGGFGLNFRGATGGYATIGSGAKGMICTDGIAFFA